MSLWKFNQFKEAIWAETDLGGLVLKELLCCSLVVVWVNCKERLFHNTLEIYPGFKYVLYSPRRRDQMNHAQRCQSEIYPGFKYVSCSPRRRDQMNYAQTCQSAQSAGLSFECVVSGCCPTMHCRDEMDELHTGVKNYNKLLTVTRQLQEHLGS